MQSVINKEPLVSIIITSYNRGKFIDDAIQSSLSQDYANLEIIISDNASTDNTDEVVKKYANEPRVKYYKNEINIGMVPNFKKAAYDLAKGEFITYISSDDYLINDKFVSKAVMLINKYDNVVLVKGYEAQDLDGSKNYVYEKDKFSYAKEFYTGEEMFWMFADLRMGFGSVLIKRDKMIEEDIFETSVTSLDFEVNLCMFLKGNVAILDENSYVWRMHSSQASGSVNIEKHIDNYNFINRPYSIAIAKGFEKSKLDRWKLKILTDWSLIYMYSYYPKKKTLYNSFVTLLQAKQPEVYASAIKNKKWILFKAIMSYSFISFPLLRIFFPVKYKYYQLLKA